MHDGMDFRHILAAIYDNRWIGAFLQTNGKRVIATVGWVGKQYDDICFAADSWPLKRKTSKAWF